MGTTIYESLLRIFLDEGDFTLDEIIEMSHERYGFDKGYIGMEVRLSVNMLKRYAIKELPNGKLQRIEEFPSFFELMTGGPESLPEGHFGRTDSKQKQFYIDLKERYGKLYPYKKERQTKVDAPF